MHLRLVFAYDGRKPGFSHDCGKKSPYLYICRRQDICRRQAALWCRKCGREGKLKSGFCIACYARERRNRVYFAGLRPRVLAWDGDTCRVCGRQRVGKRLPVHHRRSGVSKESLLITLCPGCHAAIHRTRFWRVPASPLAASLWREQHPGAPEQLVLQFDQGISPEQSQGSILWEALAG